MRERSSCAQGVRHRAAEFFRPLEEFVTSRRFRGSVGWALKSANVFEEDDVEEERMVSMTSSPMKFISAREASVLSMKASVLFHAYASASKERTTSMDADDAGAAATVAIDSGDDVEKFSSPSNSLELVCSLVIVSLMLLLDGISLFSSLLFRWQYH